MKLRVGLAAWGLALASLALLVISLRRLEPLPASLGWSWFILSLLAAGAAAVLLLADERPSAGGESP